MVNWSVANGLRDTFCSADAATLTACTDDTNNNLTPVTGPTDEQCVEKWTLKSPGIRCVRMKSSWSRKFLTPDTTAGPGQDVDLGYRPFQVLTGWHIGASPSATPLKFGAPAQSVDFGRFLRGAPEADFNSAVTGMGVTCASLAAAVMTFLF